MAVRNEHIINLEGREIGLLYTNRALANAENQLGKKVFELLQDFSNNIIGINDIAIMLRAGMEEYRREANTGNKPYTIDDAFEVMDELGFTEALTLVVTALGEVFQDNNKNPKAKKSKN